MNHLLVREDTAFPSLPCWAHPAGEAREEGKAISPVLSPRPEVPMRVIMGLLNQGGFTPPGDGVKPPRRKPENRATYDALLKEIVAMKEKSINALLAGGMLFSPTSTPVIPEICCNCRRGGGSNNLHKKCVPQEREGSPSRVTPIQGPSAKGREKRERKMEGLGPPSDGT